MGKAENIHQIMAEMPLDVLKELGYSDDKAENLKSSHRKMLRIVYGGIDSTQRSFGDLVVRQADEMDKLAGELFGTGKPNAKPRPAAPIGAAGEKSARKSSNKVSKKTIGKSTNKVVKKAASKTQKKTAAKNAQRPTRNATKKSATKVIKTSATRKTAKKSTQKLNRKTGSKSSSEKT